MFSTALQNIAALSAHPTSLFALGGVLLLIFLFLYIRHIRFTPAMLIYIGLMLALTILLPEPEEAAFRKALQELSAGSLAPETTGTELRGVRIR